MYPFCSGIKGTRFVTQVLITDSAIRITDVVRITFQHFRISFKACLRISKGA